MPSRLVAVAVEAPLMYDESISLGPRCPNDHWNGDDLLSVNNRAQPSTSKISAGFREGCSWNLG